MVCPFAIFPAHQPTLILQRDLYPLMIAALSDGVDGVEPITRSFRSSAKSFGYFAEIFAIDIAQSRSEGESVSGSGRSYRRVRL
jgi:hypothetical protein